MMIDFHTHIFPERIAEKTISLLAKNACTEPYSNGTAHSLTQRLEEAEVDIGIALPALTSPTQFESVNRFAEGINLEYADKTPRIISFAGIHPDCEDIGEKMKQIRKSGFLGVKLHPDYQGRFINDEGYVKILQYAKEYDLIVVTHAGVDGAFRDRAVACTPTLVLDLIKKVPHSKLVLAHLGANEMLDEVLDKLCGEDVYFDTAYVLRHTPEEDFKKILSRHGADRILFATDSPWSSIKNDVERIRSFSLNKNDEQRIFCDNARRLLGI